jgi:CarD family transcriptional regulator
MSYTNIGGVSLLNIGDKIVYPMHGAGVVSGVENCEVMGEHKSYYVLKMPLGNMKVMIPTDNVGSIGLRDVIPHDDVEKVKLVLQSAPEHIAGSWNKRFNVNLVKIKTGDICNVAAVVRNLILQDRFKKISTGERRLLDVAKQILISELVFACDKQPEAVEEWLYDLLDNNLLES